MRLTLAASLLALLAVFTPNAADAAASTFYLSPQGASCGDAVAWVHGLLPHAELPPQEVTPTPALRPSRS